MIHKHPRHSGGGVLLLRLDVAQIFHIVMQICIDGILLECLFVQRHCNYHMVVRWTLCNAVNVRVLLPAVRTQHILQVCLPLFNGVHHGNALMRLGVHDSQHTIAVHMFANELCSVKNLLCDISAGMNQNGRVAESTCSIGLHFLSFEIRQCEDHFRDVPKMVGYYNYVRAIALWVPIRTV